MDHKAFSKERLSPLKKLNLLAYHNVPIYPPGMSPHHAKMAAQNLYTSARLHAPLNEGYDEPLTLRTFVSKYAQSLPLRIIVEKGHHGEDKRHCIATGDIYDVHYVKHNKLASLKDASGVSHTIPLNSAVQFGPVFDPNHDPKEALRGFMFERVSDIIAQKSLPKVVRATKAHISSDCKSSVQQNEIFLVQKIVDTITRCKALQVYSITTGEQKLLNGSCLGGFITNPYAVCLHSPEIMEHFSDKLPLDVLLILGDFSMNLPYNIMSDVSSLVGIKVETSIIASTTWDDSEIIPEEEQGLVDIPVDLPIQVKIVKPRDGMKRLMTVCQQTTLRQLSTVQSAKTCSLGPCKAVERKFEREGHESPSPDHIYETMNAPVSPVSVGSCNLNPSAIRAQDGPGASLPPSTKPKPLLTQQQKSRQDEMRYHPGNNPEPERKNDIHVYDTLHKQICVESHAYTTRTPHHSIGRNIDSKAHAKLSRKRRGDIMTTPHSTSTSDTYGELLSRVEILEREVHALRSEVAKLKSKGDSRDSVSTYQSSETPEYENIKLLKTFSTEMVTKLLQAMHMSQYQKTFSSQQIDGDILSQCDEEMLQKELGISNRIHCKQLLQIITGQKSASSLLAELS